MSRPQRYFDWQAIVNERRGDEPPENTRQRLRWVLVFFALGAAIIWFRAIQLEISDGENFRQLAATPSRHEVVLPALRGQILARDGALLAGNRQAQALAVEFRYLENPPDARWLRRLARARLPARQRQPERVAATEQTVRGELLDVHHRLAQLCGLSDQVWQVRTARIARRVQDLAALVNARRLEGFEWQVLNEPDQEDLSVATVLSGLFAPPERLPPPPVTIAEQAAFHPVVADVSDEIAEEIRTHPQHWPGVKIMAYVRRDYPRGLLAANVLGHVGKTPAIGAENPSEPVGRMGIERWADERLMGQNGLEVHTTDRRGKLLTIENVRAPVAGADLVLTIDSQLQGAAEHWLDRAGRHADPRSSAGAKAARGGAVVVLDVRSGELLVAASSPRFDPNLFAMGDDRVDAILHDSRQPLFDRMAKMAIPPGSVFKTLTAIALIESKVVDPRTKFRCQGYLHDPDRLRCQLFRQHGIGHGDVTLADARAQSCNVYFFHHAGELGAAALLGWAARFEFGQPTGIDLADEAAGRLPAATELRQPSQTQLLSIGQGAFAATPLQVARLYAAIANGGRLVKPRLLRPSCAPAEAASDASQSADVGPPITGLSSATLEAVREGLMLAVNDPHGTAHDTVRLDWPVVAGKTGTAETGGGQADHAWFAGYVPANSPRWAFVVALEHGGSGAVEAGAIARQLVQHMARLGYFGAPPTAERPLAPGKG